MSIKVLSIFSGGGGIDCGFKKAGYDITTPVIVTNSDDYTEVNMQQKPYTHLETKCLICVK